jgi:hypothetical protein
MDIVKFLVFLAGKAEQIRLNAAYSGSYSDGGAGVLLDQIEFYIAGRDHTFPTKWNQYLKEYNRAHDPEYADYQRLKEKFG